MQRLTITIPIADNQTRPYKPDLWTKIEMELQRLYGGFTRISVSGQWAEVDYKGNCRVYRDESIRYEILTDREYDKLTYLAGAVCRRLGQQMVLTTCENIQSVDFIPQSNKQGDYSYCDNLWK